MSYRIFIAIDVEDPALISTVERVKGALLSSGAQMKPVEPQNLHFTIRFIGEVSRATVEAVARALSRLEFSPFVIKLEGLGAFPSEHSPRVIWIGASEGSERMKELRDKVEELLRSLGIPPEREAFVPHLTIARMKGSRPPPSFSKIFREYSDQDFGTMLVDKVRLKRSTLTPRGPIYDTLAEVRAR